MKKNKIIFITFLAFTALLLTYLLNKKNSSKCNPKIFKQTATLTDIKIKNFRLQKFFSKKDTVLTIKAYVGELCRENETAHCKNVKAKFINKNQNMATLKSNNAFFDLKNNIVKLSGNIKSKILNNPTNDNNVN